jgi:hypothetical protein
MFAWELDSEDTNPPLLRPGYATAFNP